MVGVNFQMFKLDSEKAKEPEIKLPTSVGSWILRDRNFLFLALRVKLFAVLSFKMPV